MEPLSLDPGVGHSETEFAIRSTETASVGAFKKEKCAGQRIVRQKILAVVQRLLFYKWPLIGTR